MQPIDKLVFSGIFALPTLYTVIAITAHLRFGSSFDAALLGNVAWRLANGLDSTSSMTGFPYFATHASIAIFLLAPLFRYAPNLGLPATFALQGVSLALTALAVWRVGEVLALPSIQRRLLVLTTLLAPGAFLAVRLDPHEPTLGIGALAMTMAAGLTGISVRKSWWWPLLAASCRIEMAISTVIAGLLLLTKPASRRLGFLTLGAGTAATCFSLNFLLGSRDEAASVSAHFSHLGSTANDVFRAVFERPADVLEPLLEPSMLLSVAIWLLPWGLLIPLRAPKLLLIALPTAAVAIFGVWKPADHFSHHYWYGLLAAAPLAAAVAVSRRPQLLRLSNVAFLGGLAASWAVLLPLLGVLRPLGRFETDVPRMMVEFVSQKDGSVSAPDAVVPHLINRAAIYPFPRPFEAREETVGPFRWNGELPRWIVLTSFGAENARRDPMIREVLARHYREVASPEGITAWELADAPYAQTSSPSS